MEIWKDIVGYEWKYQVSNEWSVKSLKFWREKILKNINNWKWYLRVFLSNWKEKSYKIHRLVAISFIPNPNNHPLVMHLDNDPLNNNVTNLKWWTDSMNNLQRDIEWRWFFKSNHPNKWNIWILNSKSIPIVQYDIQWNLIKKWDSSMDIKRNMWISNSSISSCCRWKLKTAGGFIWRYWDENTLIIAKSIKDLEKQLKM